MQPNPFAASKTVVLPPMARMEGMMTDNSVQTVRVLRREMMMQSNRESARSSRLCQQVGCAERAQVHARLEALRFGNHLLRDSLRRVYEECNKAAHSNSLMKDELSKFLGPEKLPEFDVFLRSCL